MIHMLMYLQNTKPVVECQTPISTVETCRERFRGDSVQDAVDKWLKHVTVEHKEDW
jgi:hypothetical protein